MHLFNNTSRHPYAFIPLAIFLLSSCGGSGSDGVSGEGDGDGGDTLPPLHHAAPLNDTGIDWCSDFNIHYNTDGTPTEKTESCLALADIYPAQDAMFGRDALSRAGLLEKVGNGAAGFDFTKLGADGLPLPIQTESWAEGGSEEDGTRWTCVQDNHTGLIWEVKLNSETHLRHTRHLYTWYNPDINSNGGYVGTQTGGTCSSSACNTHSYVQAINDTGLCGANDWYLPSRSELLSIVHNGRFEPAIDTHYFPNIYSQTITSVFWTSSPFAASSGEVWGVRFSGGDSSDIRKEYVGRVRVVRHGQ